MPGTYQLSFFWQTTRGMDGDDYKQSFDVVMGDAPENMSKVLLSIQDSTSHFKKHSKAMVDLTVETEGIYFIGFNLRKGAAQGQRLKTPLSGQPVIVRRGARATKTIIP